MPANSPADLRPPHLSVDSGKLYLILEGKRPIVQGLANTALPKFFVIAANSGTPAYHSRLNGVF